ncbi:hypothetical protein Purlil1_11087 [Purpureocillium lilacinum]|uniref:Uncharacterized protein n=1 Tax=Purpureocillium lilacinum TaxID=33203 RepID=A0ABR0BLG4_PURLI|nr:hypothetical protein Purlil1_11087 [Purpureocillium lilacinum]
MAPTRLDATSRQPPAASRDICNAKPRAGGGRRWQVPACPKCGQDGTYGGLRYRPFLQHLKQARPPLRNHPLPPGPLPRPPPLAVPHFCIEAASSWHDIRLGVMVCARTDAFVCSTAAAQSLGTRLHRCAAQSPRRHGKKQRQQWLQTSSKTQRVARFPLSSPAVSHHAAAETTPAALDGAWTQECPPRPLEAPVVAIPPIDNSLFALQPSLLPFLLVLQQRRLALLSRTPETPNCRATPSQRRRPPQTPLPLVGRVLVP